MTTPAPLTPMPAPQYVMSGEGHRIATYSWGEDTSRTVLAGHGFASSMRGTWGDTGWVRELLRRGFRVIGLADGYLVNDPESQGHAALIEWLNPDLAKPSDYASQPQGDRAVRAKQR